MEDLAKASISESRKAKLTEDIATIAQSNSVWFRLMRLYERRFVKADRVKYLIPIPSGDGVFTIPLITSATLSNSFFQAATRVMLLLM